MTFGEIIEKKLNEANISMRELARRADVDVAYISKIIKNKSVNPSYQVVIKIANALNISQQDLEKVFNLETENIEDVVKNNEKQLTYEEREAVREIVDDLVNTKDYTLNNIANLIFKIDKLQELKKSETFEEKYYIITYFSRDEIKILETNTIDNEFLRLYCSVLNCNSDDCFIIKGNIEAVPHDFKEPYTTLEDLIDTADTLSEDDELYEDYISLKNYIENIL